MLATVLLLAIAADPTPDPLPIVRDPMPIRVVNTSVITPANPRMTTSTGRVIEQRGNTWVYVDAELVSQSTYTPNSAPAVSEVTAARPFRGGYNPSHNCPSCGRAEYVQSGSGPVRGTHNHTCRSCGTVWYH